MEVGEEVDGRGERDQQSGNVDGDTRGRLGHGVRRSPLSGRSFIYLCSRSSRLPNIEETENAKGQVAKEHNERKKVNNNEEHPVATPVRFFPPFFADECLNLSSLVGAVYRPHMKQRSDVDIMRDAKLEAMGYAPQEDLKPRHDKPQMATDEMVRGTAPAGFVRCF